MKLQHVLASFLVVIFAQLSWAQTFQPTSGVNDWNIPTNWSPQTVPNSNTAAATIQPATGALTINLIVPITVNTLTLTKTGSTSDVTVGEGTQTLAFDGTNPKLTNGAGGASGQTIIAAPLSLAATTTFEQSDNNLLQFTQPISGVGGLNINRTGTTTNVTRTVVLGAANTYNGNTVFTGDSGTTNNRYLLVRLDNAGALTGNSLLLKGAVVLGINYSGGANGDFTRNVGTGGNFANDVTSTDTGWAAFGADRSVNIFGNATPSAVSYGSDATIGLNIQHALVLGEPSADRTIDFRNPMTLNGGGSNTSVRRFQINNGSAVLDARMSGALTTNDTNNSRTDVEFDGDGTVSLTGVNTYHSEFASASPGPARTGSTTLNGNGLVVRLDNAGALSPNTNLSLTGGSNANGAILGLGTGVTSFTRPLGLPSAFLTGGAVEFTGGGGFAAYGGNKSVNLGGAGATVTWGIGSFVPATKNLLLSEINSDGTLDFQNPINVAGVAARIINVADGSAAIDAVLSGGITDSASGGSIRKNGDGTLQLTTVNSYTGQTIVAGGSLRLDIAGALPGSPLSLQGGGVIGLGIGNDTFIRPLGNGAGQVTTSGTGGGWAAYGSTKTVLLNNDANYTMVWGTANQFTATQLVLSDGGANATIDFQNKIDLNGVARTIQVRNGSAAIDGKISGVISGTGSANTLTKTNPGTLELSAANTYGGTTSINSGVVLLTNLTSIPGGITGGNTANIIFGGNGNGTIGLGINDFTSGLGTGAGLVDLGTSAGFAAFYTSRAVNLGGSSAQVTWRNSTSDPGNFVVSSLRLSDVVADATVDFQNPIDLNAGARTVDVSNGTASTDAVLSGILSSGTGSLIKSGGGTLKITANNTYGGGTTINQGRLLVSNTSGSGTGSGAVTVSSTATLGGTGSISGTVTVNPGGHIAPGESIESLAVGSLIVNTGSFLDFELGVPGSPGVNSDLINVINSGGLTLTGGSVTLADAGGLAAGTYTLIDYAGTLGGDVANLGTPTGPGGFTYSLVNNASNTSIDLLVVAPAPPGDWNGDTKVNAADYVTWRKDETGFGGVEGGNPSGYVTWRENFDLNAGAAAGLSSQAVPEPATFLLLLAVIPLVAIRREPRLRR